MSTLVIDRQTLPETLSSFFRVSRLNAIPRDGGVFLTAVSENNPRQKRISIENAYGLFKDLQGMNTEIEREEGDRL